LEGGKVMNNEQALNRFTTDEYDELKIRKDFSIGKRGMAGTSVVDSYIKNAIAYEMRRMDERIQMDMLERAIQQGRTDMLRGGTRYE
jgi:hypothetical protein